MPDEDMKKLNPQIASVLVGTRNLRKINIYPLSVGDQLSMTSVITEALESFRNADDDEEMAGVVIALLQKNLPMILEFVTDSDKETPEELLKDITNTQVLDIAQIVYEQNYAGFLKKAKSLFESVMKKAESLPVSKRPSQPSVKSTDTDSKTSTEDDSKMVD
jgi:hypothetical protein